MSYIERKKLLKKVGELESLASKRVRDTPTNSPAYQRYSTQMIERASFIDVIKEQPIADIVEVVRCKDCKHLKIINDGKVYAKCRMTDFEFQPFGTDTRVHYCSYGERSENGKS